MNFYIKGSRERGAEVIKALKEKGGINPSDLDGTYEGYYWFGKDKVIQVAVRDCMLQHLCEELTLPEKKTWEPKFNVGDYFRDSIQSEVIGKITRIAEDESYIAHLIGYSPGGRVLEKDIIPWEPKRGETVLVRDSEKYVWREGIFSFEQATASRPLYHLLGGNAYLMCIPFDITKLGKVTD